MDKSALPLRRRLDKPYNFNFAFARCQINFNAKIFDLWGSIETYIN